jgi:hypothetical protein
LDEDFSLQEDTPKDAAKVRETARQSPVILSPVMMKLFFGTHKAPKTSPVRKQLP